MSFASDLKVLFHLAFAPIRGRTHQNRLESFYAGQADHYDAFRAHLLAGRQELYEQLPTPPGGIWIEMGGGTGFNLEFLGSRLSQLAQATIVDLCPSLLRQAEQRRLQNGWDNVQILEADATELSLPENQADVVTFSYSLTMISNWFLALEKARALLKPGGTLGVVDFYVSRKYPDLGNQRHGAFTRWFWPWWLSLDNVFPCPDHLPYLQRTFTTQFLAERRHRMRYFPLARVPYYLFVGRKR